MTDDAAGLGLGRRPAVDPKDHRHPMSAVLPPAPSGRQSRFWWQEGWWGYQNGFPHCVSYAWLNWLADGPVTLNGLAIPPLDPTWLYHELQRNDEWEGEEYDGTSVRAGAKVLKRLGYIGSYTWTWNAREARQAILDVGPVVLGTDWPEGCARADRRTGRMTLDGFNLGGHAYLANGIYRNGDFRIKNTHGRDRWGRNGNGRLAEAYVQRFLDAGGECCLATEVRPAPPLIQP